MEASVLSNGTFRTLVTGRFGQKTIFVLLATPTASKTYTGSVLFHTSAYTGTKQANRVPTGSKQDNSPHNDDIKGISVLLESELIGPV